MEWPLYSLVEKLIISGTDAGDTITEQTKRKIKTILIFIV